ncbi:YraN family protein [Nocardioides coralli]|uniref:YraN family protein n=1 Tax=Nocardioides coralli TaxID=2872154 RepID=UPI001CA46790|nr:YraN family protein [Nocardioides coralli]QZY28120.1 YraN family protein [Nocardioides coralli]
MTGTTTRQQGHNKALGDYGERVAARHLAERGMVELDRNWRCDEGEIDLVLRDADELVVCEVKTRTTLDHGTPHEAVSAEKLQRLRRLAVRWAERQGLVGVPVRVDLVAVLQPGKGRALVEHVRGIG